MNNETPRDDAPQDDAQPEAIDPALQRLTDYALGRFDDDAEQRAAVERELADDPEAQRYVTETRELADTVSEALHAQTAVGLTDQQHATLDQEIASMTNQPTESVDPSRGASRHGLLPFATAVAAGIAGAVLSSLITVKMLRETHPPAAEAPPVAGAPAQDSTPNKDDTQQASPRPVTVRTSHPLLDETELRKLDKPIDVAFEATPIREVLETIRDATGVNLVVEWAKLESVGADEAQISLKLQAVPARQLLKLVLAQASAVSELEPLGFDVWEDSVVVSTRRALKRNTVVLTYDVRDLVDARLTGGPLFDLNSALSGTSSGGTSGAGLFSDEPLSPIRPRLAGGHARPSDLRIAPRPTQRERVFDQANHATAVASTSLFGDDDSELEYTMAERLEEIATLIRDVSDDQEDWASYGGEHASLKYVEHKLVIKATPERHRQVLALLDQLRQGRPAPQLQPREDEPNPENLNEAAAAMRAQAEELARLRAELDDANRLAAETYELIVDNPFKLVADEPLSTFSVDVDTASYANTRRFLNDGALPPPDAVRIEELINYFRYDYAPPPADADDPFAAHLEVNACPWQRDHKLVRIGIKGKEVDAGERPPSNLVFLIDVSGSMESPDKLPLLKQGLELMVNELDDTSRVAVVVYASSEGIALPSTPATNKRAIIDAIRHLQAGGSTAGEAGIQLAYKIAEQHFIKGGVNRVILATDGDFNVGVSDTSELVRLIEQKRQTGVFLSVLGFGTGNLKDERMEQLADHGNGNYNYIDTIREAQKVLVEQMGGTIVPIAKDVKLQLEFNPSKVKSFRLIGYENRVLQHEDFNDDTKDAGEIGAGHTVTALYEIVPRAAGNPADAPAKRVDDLKYQKRPELTDAAGSDELLTLKLRYKQPDGQQSKLLSVTVNDNAEPKLADSSADFRFAASVAGFGMLLRDSPHKGNVDWSKVHELATQSLAGMPKGTELNYRQEFVKLVEKARKLTGKP